jgi:hypothetical protein
MNCYKALKINSFSGSVGIDSQAADFVTGPTGSYGESREVNGTCNIITPFTDFTNRELKCRALLDYRVEHDPEIAEKGWLIRRHYVISGVDGLCSNCALEGDLKYENNHAVVGTVTYSPSGDTQQVNFNPGEWTAFNGPWFNKFQYCKRAQEYLFAQRHPPDPWVFMTGGGAGVLGTALEFKCYDAFSGSASDFKSYDFPPTEYDPNHYSGSANGTFTWNVTIE